MYDSAEESLHMIREKYNNISFSLNEKSRRLWAASEAKAYGRGGITLVSKAIGMSNKTIDKGLKEISGVKSNADNSRIRQVGGGRKFLDSQDDMVVALEKIMSPHTIGDPESILRWSSKSVRKICNELCNLEYKVSFKTVSSLLKKLGYSLQSNIKKQEGKQNPDRDEQFHHINDQAVDFIEKGLAVISVDTKKKENIGNYKNNGKEYSLKGKPTEVKTHDFPDKTLGKVAPYGIYDIGKNKGWVSVGISSDTAAFAVNSIRTWWYKMGQELYKGTTRLMITADCGGSNGNRVRLWKAELQKLANEVNMTICVCHFPPGTSKWNKIEHRMFSYISKNWRGKPLLTTETVVNLIANTRTETGLKIRAALDYNDYNKGIKISNEEMEKINLLTDEFHPEWNYQIIPY